MWVAVGLSCRIEPSEHLSTAVHAGDDRRALGRCRSAYSRVQVRTTAERELLDLGRLSGSMRPPWPSRAQLALRSSWGPGEEVPTCTDDSGMQDRGLARGRSVRAGGVSPC